MNWTENKKFLDTFGATGIATEASSLANQALLAKRGYSVIIKVLDFQKSKTSDNSYYFVGYQS